MNMSVFCSMYHTDVTPDATISIRVLFVDDEQVILNSIRRSFHKQNHFSLFTASSITAAQHILQEEEIDIVVTDYIMPDMDGVQFSRLVRQMYPYIILFLMTGQSGLQLLKNELINTDFFGVIAKPWTNEELFQQLLTAYSALH